MALFGAGLDCLRSLGDNLLRLLESLQHSQLLLYGLFLYNKSPTSLAGLPNLCLKYSSSVLFDLRLPWMTLRFIREAVDLFMSAVGGTSLPSCMLLV
jgi:hypothetical protein